jgi:hypothetical protein
VPVQVLGAGVCFFDGVNRPGRGAGLCCVGTRGRRVKAIDYWTNVPISLTSVPWPFPWAKLVSAFQIFHVALWYLREWLLTLH